MSVEMLALERKRRVRSWAVWEDEQDSGCITRQSLVCLTLSRGFNQSVPQSPHL